MKKTTPEEFDKFVQECTYLSELMGLKDWDIGYAHEVLKDDDSDARAICETDYDGRICTIKFNRNNESLRDQNPEQIARHEMAHALLAGLVGLANKRYVTEEQVTIEEERVCTILEKIL